jgi:hypothetical protein
MTTGAGETHAASQQRAWRMVAFNFIDSLRTAREPFISGRSVLPADRVPERAQADWDHRYGRAGAARPTTTQAAAVRTRRESDLYFFKFGANCEAQIAASALGNHFFDLRRPRPDERHRVKNETSDQPIGGLFFRISQGRQDDRMLAAGQNQRVAIGDRLDERALIELVVCVGVEQRRD